MDEQALTLIETQYERAQAKRFMYGFFFVLMLILVIVGYLADEGFVVPAKEEIPYLPLNFGAYGCQGIAAALVVLLIGGMLYLFITQLRNGSGILGAIFKTMAIYILVVGLFTGIVEMIFSKVGPIEFNFFWLNDRLNDPIPGPSETLEGVIWGCLLFDIPLLLFVWRFLHHKKTCAKLKEPAEQAKLYREEKERLQKEEQERQRQAKREQKERERRARAERERRWYAQYEAAQNSEFDFFAGCTTLEQLDTRYKGLMRAYHPDKCSGDLEMSQKINAQYQEKKNQMDEDNKNKTNDEHHDSEKS